MADNITTKDALGSNRVIRTTDTASIHIPHHIVASLPNDPLGLIADVGVITDTPGTISGKIRGLVKWAFERMPASLGQKTMAFSLPVALASDQGAVLMQPQAIASGGCSIYRSISLQDTGVTAKASAGTVYSITAFNSAGTTQFLKVYDKVGLPTSVDTPVLTIPVGPSGMFQMSVAVGVAFSLGIGLRGTTAIADNDIGNPLANTLTANILYK